MHLWNFSREDGKYSNEFDSSAAVKWTPVLTHLISDKHDEDVAGMIMQLIKQSDRKSRRVMAVWVYCSYSYWKLKLTEF